MILHKTAPSRRIEIHVMINQFESWLHVRTSTVAMLSSCHPLQNLIFAENALPSEV